MNESKIFIVLGCDEVKTSDVQDIIRPTGTAAQTLRNSKRLVTNRSPVISKTNRYSSENLIITKTDYDGRNADESFQPIQWSSPLHLVDNQEWHTTTTDYHRLNATPTRSPHIRQDHSLTVQGTLSQSFLFWHKFALKTYSHTHIHTPLNPNMNLKSSTILIRIINYNFNLFI